MKRIAVLLADGFEEIEAVTPVDVLRRGGVEVVLAGVTGKEVSGAHGLKILCDTTIESIDAADFDGVVIPGGMPGASNIAGSLESTQFIKSIHSEKKLVAAICAAPSVVLSPLNILDGRKATGYPGSESGFSNTVSISTGKVVIDGNVITSRGAGTASDFSLAILEYLEGPVKAEKIAEAMLFSGT